MIAIACAGCSNSQASKSSVNLDNGLPLPQIPDTLRVPQQRADYLVAHFWDAMDFSNRKYALDTTFMEMAFADYASVMPIATPGMPLQKSVNELMKQASVDEKAYRMLGSVAEKYLYEIDSPVYDEECYRYFVKAQLVNPDLDSAVRTRLEFQDQCLDLNRPGTVINDFTFVDRDGKTRNLLSCVDRATRSLIIFYDPDCEDCHELMSHLQEEQWVNNAIDHEWLSIIAIAGYETRDRWEATKDQLPQNWIVGLDTTDVEGNDLFYLPNTPSLYAVDNQGIVIVKNKQPQPTIEALME